MLDEVARIADDYVLKHENLKQTLNLRDQVTLFR